MIITIDGPAGSGKSTTAKLLAGKLHAIYLDTGAMYRAATLVALEKGVDPDDRAAVKEIADSISITFMESESGQKTFIDGKDRSSDIRSPEVDRAVSRVSAHREVRERMVSLQRKMGHENPKVVVEGRDTGSVVFPDADHKFYLQADTRNRALRRVIQRGDDPGLTEGVVEDMIRRDEMDSTRKESPLTVPEGAVVIDNTSLSIDETLDKILEFIV